MLYLQLFWEFFKTGLFAIGGGMATLPFLYDMADKTGWFTRAQLADMIAVSESTPGPLAVNMATFIGASQGGFAGSLLATLGVVLPSFFIILLIVAALKNLLQYPVVSAFLAGVRPCVVALILSTALTMALDALLGIAVFGDGFSPDLRAIAVFGLLIAVHFAFKRLRGKAPSPLAMIGLSACLGMLFWGL